MNTPQLTLDRLTKQFGSTIAVDGVSATLEPGVIGLLGANGAGKTTIMRMICQVLQPSSGALYYNKKPVAEDAVGFRSCLGYLPQNFGYYPSFTTLDFLLYIASCKGLTSHQAKERAHALLKEVDLLGEAKKKVKTLSGGMKQRLGIAQALLNDPSVLILDEPTAGLDPKERVRFRNLISQISKDKIVLLSTHIVSDVAYIANRILMMQKGRIVLDGSPEKIVEAARGKVFELTTSQAVADQLAATSLVANVHYLENGKAVVRVIEDCAPSSDAIAADPTLEDLYLYLFRTHTNTDERMA